MRAVSAPCNEREPMDVLRGVVRYAYGGRHCQRDSVHHLRHWECSIPPSTIRSGGRPAFGGHRLKYDCGNPTVGHYNVNLAYSGAHAAPREHFPQRTVGRVPR